MAPTDSVHQEVEERAVERTGCAGCGNTEATLMAPRPNVGHGYEGPLFCMFCSPRFGFSVVDAHAVCDFSGRLF